MVLERCRVCGGSGLVEAEFGAGARNPDDHAPADQKRKCPACRGEGMQTADRPVTYPPHPAPADPGWRRKPEWIELPKPFCAAALEGVRS
jgi:hypothetical protein